nr:carbohydrate ABC transporter permease [uncultured Eisenbergiella sp.]
MNENKKIKQSPGSRAFDWFNYIFLALFSVTILFPFWNLFVQSISSPDAGIVDALQMWPKKFSAFNYEYVLSNKYIWTGYRETLIRTVAGTALSVTLTAMGAYVLSKKNLPNRNFWTTVVLIPMFFSGGMIPSYLWMVNLHLIDNRLALILPGLVSSYNLIIMRNFFMSIPEGLEESAKIDGAGSIRIFFSIVLPISKAVLATIALWVMVGHWNAWFDATIYMRDANKLPLQVVLRRILMEGTQQMMDMNSTDTNHVTPDTLKAATTFVCMLPIMCVYPFVQKYFVKGVIIGSLKG